MINIETDLSHNETEITCEIRKDISIIGDISYVGPRGIIGPEGKSAYEVWLDEGHEGSVDDFLQFNQGYYIYTQREPSKEWYIYHGLNKRPSVTVVDSGDNVVVGTISYIDNDTVKLTFAIEFSGRVYIN